MECVGQTSPPLPQPVQMRLDIARKRCNLPMPVLSAPSSLSPTCQDTLLTSKPNFQQSFQGSFQPDTAHHIVMECSRLQNPFQHATSMTSFRNEPSGNASHPGPLRTAMKSLSQPLPMLNSQVEAFETSEASGLGNEDLKGRAQSLQLERGMLAEHSESSLLAGRAFSLEVATSHQPPSQQSSLSSRWGPH